MTLHPIHPFMFGPHGHHHPMQDGERLLFVDPQGYVRETNGWSIEVENVALWDEDMPLKVWGFDPETGAARDLTERFEAEVREMQEPAHTPPSTYDAGRTA